MPLVSDASCRSCALSRLTWGFFLDACYSLVVSFLMEAPKWTWLSQCALTRAGQRVKVFFPTMPTLLWLLRHDLWVNTFAAGVQPWLMLNWWCIGLSRSSAKLILWSCAISSLGQDLVFALDGIFIGLFFFFFPPKSLKILLHAILPPAHWLLTLNWYHPETCCKCTHSQCLSP